MSSSVPPMCPVCDSTDVPGLPPFGCERAEVVRHRMPMRARGRNAAAALVLALVLLGACNENDLTWEGVASCRIADMRGTRCHDYMLVDPNQRLSLQNICSGTGSMWDGND